MFNISNVATLYVSQEKGNNAFSGLTKEITEIDGPVKTIEAALEKVAEIRKKGALQPVSIVILDEEFYIDKPILIQKPLDRITIRGDKNTTVYGGFKLEGLKKDKFNGRECLSAYVPQIKEGLWFTDFFVNGKRADLTAIPKNGFFLPESVENTKEVYDAESKWFIPRPEERELFKILKNFTDCMVSYYHFWVDGHSPIESYDAASGKVEMKYKSRFSISGYVNGAIMRYQIENVAEAFENPNEWYLDRNNATVYYIPEDKEADADSVTAYVPVCDKLFIVKGEKDDKIEDVYFRNINFKLTKGDYESRLKTDVHTPLPDDEVGYGADEQAADNASGAMEYQYARRCGTENCIFENLGLYAVNILQGCENIRIFGNRFYDIGAGAVKIGGGAFGCDKADETFGNVISQNHITCCGRRYAAACGILIKHSYDNRISHNEIGYLYYTGISAGWVWGYKDSITKGNIIEKNHVHHIGQGKLSDMGAIYTLGSQPGTVIRNNIVHDVAGFRYGGTGIYTDEGSSYILIEKNILYNIHTAAFFQHYGKMNTIRNNIVAKSGECLHQSRTEPHTGIISENNIFVTDGSCSIGFGYDEEPDKGDILNVKGNHNLYWDINGKHRAIKFQDELLSLKDVQREYGLETGSIIKNPMFRDYQNNDFGLDDNSPAYEMGFEKIDISDVGVTIELRD